MKNNSFVTIRSLSLLGQRGTFGKTVCDLAEKNDLIWAMTADQGAGAAVYRFKEKFPDRFLNFGISEQNAIGVCSGLANEGYIPFVAFQSVFTSMRCADQVRVMMSYMKLPVKLVGIFSGLTQGDCGPTHYALQDLALFRSMENIVVLSPSDAFQTEKCVQKAAEIKTPVYLRLGGAINTPIIYKEDFDFEIGKAITLREGTDVAVIATGTMVYNALKAAEKLEGNGISVKIVDMHTIKPLDIEAVKAACSVKLLVTVEEHSVHGGLGGAVAEALALEAKRPPHLIIGVSGDYPHAASYPYLLEQAGLTPEQIALKIQKTYEEICK
ncbi:MAG: transketolase [Alphaproteobacteria bacterium]|nr:transketolase [Alphaproteobacteria bacterium]